MIRRKTKQREAIYQSICDMGHASINEIKEYLQSMNIIVPTATLYRNLSILLDDGLIRSIQSNEFEVYEATFRKPHHHFHCLKCHNIYDIMSNQIQLIYKNPDVLNDFIIQQENVLIHGICPRCGKKK